MYQLEKEVQLYMSLLSLLALMRGLILVPGLWKGETMRREHSGEVGPFPLPL